MIEKIISGGQTGTDRAALDWAISHGIPHGGWCPRGRLAEDGEIPRRYKLQEMESTEYEQRTAQNVIDSDGTVIFSIKPSLTGGSKRTLELAVEQTKPVLHIHAEQLDPGQLLNAFIAQHQIKVLNVAGPRASSEPAVAELVPRVLDATFSC